MILLPPIPQLSTFHKSKPCSTNYRIYPVRGEYQIILRVLQKGFGSAMPCLRDKQLNSNMKFTDLLYQASLLYLVHQPSYQNPNYNATPFTTSLSLKVSLPIQSSNLLRPLLTKQIVAQASRRASLPTSPLRCRTDVLTATENLYQRRGINESHQVHSPFCHPSTPNPTIPLSLV